MKLMSYWVYLTDDAGQTVQVESHQEGGTYCVGGTSEAEINVTWNYAKHFNFRGLDGRGAKDTVAELEEAIGRLKADRSADYWDPTEGNVRHTLCVLLGWAKANPGAAWVVH